MSRTLWLRGVMLLVLIGVVGHLFYWYWPRPRASVPSPASRVAGLVLAEGDPEIRVWIPFPHQNLGALEDHLGELESLGWTLQELLGSSRVSGLPSFGPFRVPPATEIAIASDRAGERIVAMARVYPLAAWLFRAAGLLAGNPWMSGGDLKLGGREIRVEWQGSLWIARTEGMELGFASSRADVGRSLMLLRVGALPGPVPSGLYRLLAHGHRMVLTSNLSRDPYSPPGIDHLRLEETAFFWTRLESSGEARVFQSLVALSGRPSQEWALPPLLIAGTAGTGTWELPGERALTAIGAEVFTRSLGNWQMRSYDPESLRLGENLVAGLEAFAAEAGQPDVVSVGYLDLEEAVQIVLGVGNAIQRVPVIGESEARRWLAFSRLLEEMAGISGIVLWLAEPDRLELQFLPPVAD